MSNLGHVLASGCVCAPFGVRGQPTQDVRHGLAAGEHNRPARKADQGRLQPHRPIDKHISRDYGWVGRTRQILELAADAAGEYALAVR